MQRGNTKNKKARAGYMISAIAELYKLHPQTLRLYERVGLLKPSRSEGNTRLYTDSDLERLEVILTLTREMGVNLAGIEIILNMREKMAEMQHQMEAFTSFVQQELSRGMRSGRARPAEGALVRVPPPKVIRVHKYLHVSRWSRWNLSKALGNRLPADLERRLSGRDLEARANQAILVCSVDTNGWPHPALLSYFEMIAKDDRNVRLAIYAGTSTLENLRRNGKLTLMIVEERVAYYVKGSVQELAREMDCSPHNSKLNFVVETVLADAANEEFEPGAYITGGISYARTADPVKAQELLKELLL